jgi:NAD(P)H-quinone oxidoreductase subunit 6
MSSPPTFEAIMAFVRELLGSGQTIAFFMLAALTLGSAGIVALSRNIIYSTIALLGTFLGIAGLYIQLSADFLAAVQVLVYVGGTLTLILFAVMLTSQIENVRTSNTSRERWGPFVLVGFVLLVLGIAATHPETTWPAQAKGVMPSTAKLGHALLSDYMLVFEIGSVVLLGAMIGAVALARRAVRRGEHKD